MILGTPIMPAPLPDAAKVQVPTPLADVLLHAAESLPQYDNQEFYSTDLQSLGAWSNSASLAIGI